MKGLKKFYTLVLILTFFLFLSPDVYAITANTQQKNVILQLTTTCENSQTKLNFNYAENIGDGRGITFGCIGFTTGTYDGNILIHYYTKLNPNNTLAKYIPALDKIDNEKHTSDGLNGNTKGLENFIKDVKVCNDPLFIKAQLYELNQMYWNPALSLANSIGAKNQLTLAFIYDMCVNHGPDGAEDFVTQAKNKLGGLPKNGIDENKFLSSVMDYRYSFLKGDDPNGSDRVNAYRKLLTANNVNLKTNFKFTVYGDTFTIDGNVGYEDSNTPSAPVASISASTLLGTAPLNVAFTATNANTSSTWVWDFGDGSTATGQNPSHVYKSAGKYIVKLTASNTAGSSTATVEILVKNSGVNNGETNDNDNAIDAGKNTYKWPKARSTYNQHKGQASFRVMVKDKSTKSSYKWHWKCKDGKTSRPTNLIQNHTKTGNYKGISKVSNSKGYSNDSNRGTVRLMRKVTNYKK